LLLPDEEEEHRASPESHNRDEAASPPDPVAEPIVKPLVDRLWRAIHAHETRIGYECDTGRFARLVGPSLQERYAVLFAPPFLSESDKSWLSTIRGTPRGDLIFFTSTNCWHSVYSI